MFKLNYTYRKPKKEFKELQAPTEAREQQAFVEWLRIKKIKHSYIAQDTRTPYMGTIMRNLSLGLTKGVPDLMIYISEDQSNTGKAILLFIEMKRKKGYTVNPAQKEWIDCLNKVSGVCAYVGIGCDCAIELVSKHIKI